MPKICILQSGFVSTTDKNLYLDMGEETSFRNQVLNQDLDMGRAEFFYHPGITAMANQYMAKHEVIDTFEFRDKLLKATFLAFSCRSMQEWLRAQRTSPFMASTHRAFMIETLNFVCGVPRSMSPVQWDRLIDTSTANQNVVYDFDDMFSKTHAPHPVPESMHEFVLSWVRKENGFEDMLISMWLIFGRRTVTKTLNYSKHNKNIEPIGLASPVAGV